MSQNKLIVIQKYFANALKKNQIYFLNNSIKSLVLFVKKLDNSLRFCVNYCELNKITIKNKYSFSFLLKIFKRFANIKRFIKINLYNIYYCIQIY